MSPFRIPLQHTKPLMIMTPYKKVTKLLAHEHELCKVEFCDCNGKDVREDKIILQSISLQLPPNPEIFSLRDQRRTLVQM